MHGVRHSSFSYVQSQPHPPHISLSPHYFSPLFPSPCTPNHCVFEFPPKCFLICLKILTLLVFNSNFTSILDIVIFLWFGIDVFIWIY